MSVEVSLSSETRTVLDRHNLRPLWELEEEEFGEERTDLEPEVWEWTAIRDAIDRIEQDVPVEDLPPGFQRRVAVPVNPAYPGSVSHTIYVGVQTVSPGETAPAHRHGANALRFTISGNEDLRTVVGGEAFPMLDNDLVTTPQWEWHDHHNAGEETAAWLDVLDLPLVFDSLNVGNVFEDHGDERQTVDRPEGFYESQYGTLSPSGGRSGRDGRDGGDGGDGGDGRDGRDADSIPGPFEGTREPTPPYRFGWADVEETLENAREVGELDPYDGVAMDYVNPATGRPPLFPTFGVRAQLVESATDAHRHNATEVYYVADGEGATHVGDRTLEWGDRDLFVVPANTAHNHEPDGEATLLALTDEPLLRGINFYHEVAE